MNIPKYIIVHHSGGTDANPLADTSNQTFEIIKGWHLKLGWRDVGYHYVIEKSGKLFKGRPEEKEGAHTIGHNSDSIGICLVGNFDTTLPTTEQVDSLRDLLKTLILKYEIPIINIVPHRKFANKTCYGNKLKDDWAQNLLLEVPVVKEEMVTLPKKLLVEITKYI